jgi:nitroimidazol reductase NimA-like FMN-containing flavoprotein (pyridoxamine 5'-phosphate oxidase superfamily)
MNEQSMPPPTIGSTATSRDAAALDVLDRPECLALLATATVGRIAYSVHGGARIEVVNFVVDGDEVVIRMAVGAKSIAIGRGSHLALEADRLDEATGTGWNVTIAGPVSWVDDVDEVARLEGMLRCWAPGHRPHFARLKPALVFGRRVRAAHLPG